MKREDDQRLWDLLGSSVEQQPGPFFSRNVLREIRQQPTWSQRFGSAFTLKRVVPATAAAAILIAITFFTRTSSQSPSAASNQDDVIAKLNVEDYEVVADLDDLVAVDDNSLWTESSSL
jgi:hypothetical protein